MKNYRHVVRAITETPWAILPSTLGVILDLVEYRAEGNKLTAEEVRERVGVRAAARPQTRSGGGAVAVLPLYGVLIPRANLMSEMSGGTSLERFSTALRELANEPSVGTIVLDVDSPGGSATMVPEVAAEIRAAREQKPVIAVANALAASGAYWLASQADELIVTPSGYVGSIGVFTSHEDWSKFDEAFGVKTTLISAGKFKTEGNMFEPLSEEAAAYMQSLVDDVYALFVADVAKGRGVSASDVRNGFGQGRILSAKRAVKEGMADRVDTLEATIARLVRRPQGGQASGAGVLDLEALAARADRQRTIEVVIEGDASRLEAALEALAEEDGEPEGLAEQVPEGAEPSPAEYVEGAERLLARPAVRAAQRALATDEGGR